MKILSRMGGSVERPRSGACEKHRAECEAYGLLRSYVRPALACSLYPSRGYLRNPSGLEKGSSKKFGFLEYREAFVERVVIEIVSPFQSFRLARLCHNSSSRPSPVKRGARRDPESPGSIKFFWIQDLTSFVRNDVSEIATQSRKPESRSFRKPPLDPGFRRGDEIRTETRP